MTSVKEYKEELLTHSVAEPELDACVSELKKKIRSRGPLPYASEEKQIAYVDALQEFPFGRFLLKHRGLNGYWTHYILTYPERKAMGSYDELHPLEEFILENAPSVKATQERYGIFKRLLQSLIKENARMADIPCGLMGTYNSLNFHGIENYKLLGIDLDPYSIQQAHELATRTDRHEHLEFIHSDAWDFHRELDAPLDVLSSNGLNIYVKDEERVVDLYRELYCTLKPGGTFIGSFLTPPPSISDESCWKMDKINQEHLLAQKTLLTDILEVKWESFRTVEKTIKQLEEAGFMDIEIHFDSACIMPTFSARR